MLKGCASRVRLNLSASPSDCEMFSACEFVASTDLLNQLGLKVTPSICMCVVSLVHHNDTAVLGTLRSTTRQTFDGAVLICMNKKSFLKCGNCNKRLKLILVTCEQFLFG